MTRDFLLEYLGEMTLYKSKYRIESIRLKGWNYLSNGYYFTNICTKNREYLFGKIENGVMLLSDIGKMAEKYWQEIPNHFPFVELDEFIVMPNHIHGIVIIEKNDGNDCRDVACNVSTRVIDKKMSSISPKTNSLSTTIRSYKSAVSKSVHEFYPDFAWQSRFHDRIIRDNDELNRIRKYIVNNPHNWAKDDNYLPEVAQ